jgi:LemA protein
MQFIVLTVFILVVIWIIIIYNRLVRHKYLVREGWSGVDVQLKRRADLIPNLIDAIKKYMKHEKQLLTKITELRVECLKAREIKKKARLESDLSRSLSDLFVMVEDYPDLKANQNVLQLQNQLAEVEDQIQLARRYYNGTVRNMNILIESFPSNFVAKMFRFTKKEYFEIKKPDRAVPKIK